MAATGFTLITLQILLLLAFQFIYGYVYHQLTILIAMNMAGIAWKLAGLSTASLSAIVTLPCHGIDPVLLALSAPALIFIVSLLARYPEWRNVAGSAVYLSRLAALSEYLGAINSPSRRRSTFMTGTAIEAGHALCHRSAGRMRGRARREH